MKLFLDDLRNPQQVYPNQVDWVVVRDYNGFVKVVTENYDLTEKLPEVISFDHDLSEEAYLGDYSRSRTGYDCAKWLVEFCHRNSLTIPQYNVHSMNPVGKQNIIQLLTHYNCKNETNKI